MKAHNLLKSILKDLPLPKDVRSWVCECGATNSDIVHSYCQFCGK